MRSSGRRVALAAAGAVLALAVIGRAQGPGVSAEYTQAVAQETAVRDRLRAPEDTSRAAILRGARSVVAAYESLVTRYPESGYSDNALWQAAALSADVFWAFGEAEDREAALRLLERLDATYPGSPLRKPAPDLAARLRGRPATAPQRAEAPAPVPRQPAGAAPVTASSAPPPAASAAGASQAAETLPTAPGTADRSGVSPAPRPETRTVVGRSTLTAIRREVLPDVLRITLELEHEAPYSDGSLGGPPRVFVDLRNTAIAAALRNAEIRFDDDLVRQVRLGRHEDARTRVVLDLTEPGRHSIYALYDPYRVVIDFERRRPDAASTDSSAVRESAVAAPVLPSNPGPPPRVRRADPPPLEPRLRRPTYVAAAPVAIARPDPIASLLPAPAPPSVNGRGGFSVSRQLGLGIERIVVDPGHGGRDPGAEVSRLNEAALVLDIALRLERVMREQHGVDVVLTRRSDAFVSLEERTAIANDADADLFLSIHANASADARAVGIETYYLNFATTPAAEAIAARENAGSTRTMRELNDIVRTIATNNKVDESRDFARAVQTAMVNGLRRVNRSTRNLGVKQAPFMVLVGARMPGLLTEVGFLTHRQEGALLRTERYRQQIAEAMAAGILSYQRSLKATRTTVAAN